VPVACFNKWAVHSTDLHYSAIILFFSEIFFYNKSALRWYDSVSSSLYGNPKLGALSLCVLACTLKEGAEYGVEGAHSRWYCGANKLQAQFSIWTTRSELFYTVVLNVLVKMQLAVFTELSKLVSLHVLG
jgi:hypothetical protein